MNGKNLAKGPDLEKYINDQNRKRFIQYSEGARLFGMRYWSFVRFCKRAGAVITLRKTAIVDLDVLEDYIEQFNEYREDTEMEDAMPRKKEKAPIDERMINGKKWVRLDEAAELYSVSTKTIEKWAEQSKAKYKIDGVVLFSTTKLDMFIENMGQEDL
ncbi:DUF6462 family protein [Butyrivibrio sp. INlla14]|uniref:DUF6462 family protein n=1 Tax=Butyrivibrio sp. INlla14 TaxID=1520808 RepID=UPI000875F27D|nr:DUF6462 family protein [Butyrivibrio sp. INlla14]SCY13420.1 hypothetical protein SAMN02910371_01158 [Butyrivibrio sp. INlla14]